MCIYVHGIDLIGREKEINGKVYYTTIEGEVIATDEAYVWDFTLNKFI
jgi:predicted RNA-binding protein